MVQAPKCKVCGSSHFGGAHVWPGARPSIAPKPMVTKTSSGPDPRDAEIVRLKARIAELEAKLAPPKTADRAAYMREYRARKRG